MKDYIHLAGTTPNAEKCAQLGDSEYLRDARMEAHAYIKQLHRLFGANPMGTRFAITKCPHELGSYLDIRFYFDDEDQGHVAYMDRVERGCDYWDEIVRAELNQAGYATGADSIEI